ncbi:MAG: RNA-binding protein [Desulfurococcaceae archaeon]
MKLLGITENWTKNGHLIVRPYVKDVLKYVGAIVYDSSGRRVGVVTDVIGRVDNPRIVAKLDCRDLGELLLSRKERLYALLPRERRGRGGRP